MKKIGILTFHRAINYGAFLQCYSLATYVQSLFPAYKVEVIDYETVDEYIITIKGLFKVHSLKEFIAKVKRYRLFRRDLINYLPLSSKRCVSNKPDAIASHYSGEYEAIIVGSDAVWNSFSDKEKLNFYLYKVHTKKFSYAASTSGLQLINVSAETKDEIKKLLNDFIYIGVREKKSENVLSKLNIDKQIFHNCDPTCFIDLDKINIKLDVKLKKKGIGIAKPVICLMTNNAVLGKMVRESFGSTHQILSLYTKNDYADITLYDLSPMEFAVLFRYVNLLFSRYFHGCYLCLRNGTPVIAVDEIKEPDHEMSKIQYLFDRLGMNDRYYNSHCLNEKDYSAMMDKAQTLMDTDQRSFIMNKLEEECKYKESFTEAIINELN